MRFLWSGFDVASSTYNGEYSNDSIKKIASLIEEEILKFR